MYSNVTNRYDNIENNILKQNIGITHAQSSKFRNHESSIGVMLNQMIWGT